MQFMFMQSHLEWYGLIILPSLIPCAQTLPGIFSDPRYKSVTFTYWSRLNAFMKVLHVRNTASTALPDCNVMGIFLRSPKDALKTIKLQTWIWNPINICVIKPLFTQVLRKPKGVLTQCVHVLTHLDVMNNFFPLGNQLTPSTHEPAITKMLNIEKRTDSWTEAKIPQEAKHLWDFKGSSFKERWTLA